MLIFIIRFLAPNLDGVVSKPPLPTGLEGYDLADLL
jgi:hypothetical protein